MLGIEFTESGEKCNQYPSSRSTRAFLYYKSGEMW